MSGQTVTVHCRLVAHSTGEEFDASWNRGAPFRFPLGAGRVIGGWGQGCGRHEGRRLASCGSPATVTATAARAVIKPGETLVFVVDLLGAS